MARRKSTVSTYEPSTRFPLKPAEWQRVVKSLRLSPRQAQIVKLILKGSNDKQIALELGLSIPTVRTHMKRMYDRMKLDDRVQLVSRIFIEAWKYKQA